MYHNLEFRMNGLIELESPDSTRLPHVVLQDWTRVRAQVKPYVLESGRGAIEVADLLLEDGSAARAVRFASFRFLDD
jgi:hypothetical protein